jgi:AraC family transcriptional regulator
MQLRIKNMVCARCVRVVQEELTALGLPVQQVALGEVALGKELAPDELLLVRNTLERSGFELLDDRKAQQVEQLKQTVIELIQRPDLKQAAQNYSDYLAGKLGLSYSYLSGLFSAAENLTIEQYLIQQKIERVKELLVYDELTLSEIAFQLGYSSAQHLSNQFRKVTGFTPSHFKQIGRDRRKFLDKVGEA